MAGCRAGVQVVVAVAIQESASGGQLENLGVLEPWESEELWGEPEDREQPTTVTAPRRRRVSQWPSVHMCTYIHTYIHTHQVFLRIARFRGTSFSPKCSKKSTRCDFLPLRRPSPYPRVPLAKLCSAQNRHQACSIKPLRYQPSNSTPQTRTLVW